MSKKPKGKPSDKNKGKSKGGTLAGGHEGESKDAAVTVRFVKTEEDVEAFLEMASLAHEESRYRDFPYDSFSRKDLWRERLLGKKTNFVALLAEFHKKPVGVLVAMLGKYLYSDDPATQCHSFYVRPENRSGVSAIKLLHAYRRWAEAQGAIAMSVHVTSGIRIKTTDKLLRRLGFEQTGGNYEISLVKPEKDE